MDEYFFTQMRELLGDAQYGEFMDAYNNAPRHKALRVNTLKISVAEFLRLAGGAELKSNILCPQSFMCDIKPSLDPLYHAGLYYMQEPSASAAVYALSPYIGKRVLDLCAAPGGKSTQAAAFMDGGIIFCNDVERKRIRALTDNIERLGVTNAVITCNTAAEYRAAGFDGYFDTLIVDAPCSGGGMSRYEDVAYTRETVAGCAARQRAILDDATRLLCNGGYMLYSTCTFSREENEDIVAYIRSLGFDTVDIPLPAGAERGIGEKDARRVYPHKFDGEGHFYCVLVKRGGSDECFKDCEHIKRVRQKTAGADLDCVALRGKTLLPISPPELDGLRIVRAGVPVTDERGEPSHALSHALPPQVFGAVELGENAAEYLCGGQLDISAPFGYRVATVNGYALGWVKSARSGNGSAALKNLYPKYARIKRV